MTKSKHWLKVIQVTWYRTLQKYSTYPCGEENDNLLRQNKQQYVACVIYQQKRRAHLSLYKKHANFVPPQPISNLHISWVLWVVFFFLFSAFETYKQIFCQTRTHQPQYPMSIVNLISSLTYSYFYYLLRKQYSSASSFVISHYHCKSCSNCWTHCFCFFF